MISHGIDTAHRTGAAVTVTEAVRTTERTFTLRSELKFGGSQNVTLTICTTLRLTALKLAIHRST